MNQKGLEMPIQIFIVLFVLLAVAMLVLQMFTQQISDSAEELKKQTAERNAQQELQAKEQKCKSACSCDTLEQKAVFCYTKVQGGLNFDGTGLANNFFERAGIGLCEDSVYCSQLTSCNCDLTATNCVQVLCQYWNSQGISTNVMNKKLRQFFQPGSCAVPEDKKDTFWFYMLEPNLSCG